MIVFGFFPAAGFADDVCTSTATLKVGDASGHVDEVLPVQITVTNADKLAGAAFTVQYSSSLEVDTDLIDSPFFDTFYNQLSDPTNDPLLDKVSDPIDNGNGTYTFQVNGHDDITVPPKVDGTSYPYPFIMNPQDDGTGTTKLHISAARIIPAVGTDETTLFTLYFKLKDGEPTGSYEVKIIPTTLYNTDAGYDENGETIDLLVGSDISIDVSQSDAFPVLLCAGDYSTHVTAGQVTFTDSGDDNLPDSWEMRYFHSLSASNGSGDYDHDGLSDAQEYAISSDPTDNTSPADITSPGPTVTGTSVTFKGSFKIDGTDAVAGDAVAVFDPQGVLCGAASVTTAGEYQVTVYGDDATTTDTDEGAEAGDPLTFVIYDANETKYIQVGNSMFSATDVGGTATPSAIPPQWRTDNDPLGLNLNVTSECTFSFQLKAGWNLFSFPLKVVYYTGENPPNVPLFNNIDAEPVSSIDDVLSSISGKYEVITSYDGKKHTYYPGLSAEYQYLNTMTYMAGGYGYWIKMKEAATLVLTGSCLDPSEALTLSAGWHLVGYWSASAHYESAEQPDFTIPDYSWEAISIDNTVSSISGKFGIITSYDGKKHTYYPGLSAEYQYLNTMTYMAPGYGYWIKMNSEGSLHY